MAEASVEYLLNKIDAALTRELALPDKIKTDVRNLKDELRMMTTVVKAADSGLEQHPQLLVWIQQVQASAHDIEDVLDMIELDLAEGHVSRINKFTRWARDHSMADFIDDIKKNLQNIKEIRNGYSVIGNSSGASSTTPADHLPSRTAYLSLREAETVGLEDDKDRMMTWALDMRESCKKVMFVAGMGGSGKTTLVNQVFDAVKKDFDFHAWIEVSNNARGDEIFYKLWHQLCNSNKESSSQRWHSVATGVDSMIRKLQESLQFQRYLIVLDDLWSKKDWENIDHAIPRDHNCRIIITTRRGDIACSRRDDSISIHNVQPLPQEKAEQLLHRKAFPTDGSCPPGLLGWSNAVLRKCEGLPLAISEIGQKLSATRASESEWKKIHDSLGSDLGRDGGLSNITKVLMLSYHDLPHELKYCFLFLNLFPNDFPINTRKLIRLWIAEGFIKEKSGKELEDVGEEYLKELIERNLVQVSELDFDGRPRGCRIHNIVHDIILSKLQEEGYGVICCAKQEGNISQKTRRICIQAEEFKMPSSCQEDLRARTLLIFSPEIRSSVRFSSFKLLKILHLQGFNLHKFPEEIGELFLLRYLCLRNTSIKRIPHSIGNLRYLETLDLKQTMVKKLPKEIRNLEKLRHLLVCRYKTGLYVAFDPAEGFELSIDIAALSNLQKLSFVRAHAHRKLIVPELKRSCDAIQMLQHLKKLRKLGIIDLLRKDGKSLCETIQCLKNLCSLNLTSRDAEEILDIEGISNPPRLQRLCLKGKLERIPSWISRLQELVRLRLQWSQLSASCNPFEQLQDLPNLLELQLINAYTGAQLNFNAGKFQKLKILDFEQLEQLKWVMMEVGTLPCLQKLIIKQCNNLEQVPAGIESLRSLTELLLYDMPMSFVEPIRKGGEMHYLVQQIPSIHSYSFDQQRKRIAEDLHA